MIRSLTESMKGCMDWVQSKTKHTSKLLNFAALSLASSKFQAHLLALSYLQVLAYAAISILQAALQPKLPIQIGFGFFPLLLKEQCPCYQPTDLPIYRAT